MNFRTNTQTMMMKQTEKTSFHESFGHKLMLLLPVPVSMYMPTTLNACLFKIFDYVIFNSISSINLMVFGLSSFHILIHTHTLVVHWAAEDSSPLTQQFNGTNILNDLFIHLWTESNRSDGACEQTTDHFIVCPFTLMGKCKKKKKKKEMRRRRR